MRKISKKRAAEVAEHLAAETAKWGAKTYVALTNYDFGLSIMIERPDGIRKGWVAGLVNYPPRPDEIETWEPVTKAIGPAMKAALEFARPN